MKDIYYSLIVILPSLVFVFGSFLVLFCIARKDKTRKEHLKRWAVSNIFSDIIKKKTKNREETRWLLKDIDLTNEKRILSRIFISFISLSFGLIGGMAILFLQILLLDVSYSCEQNSENTKDCFEYKLWRTDGGWGRDPIDCNSAAVQNGTVQVVCYKFVFNIGLASGASYGGFKLAMAVVNVATTLMLMAAKPKHVCWIKTIVALVYLCLLAGIIAIHSTSYRVSFLSGNLVIILQMILVMGIVCSFVFTIPWNDLIALKPRDNEQDVGLENPAANVV